MTRIVFFDDGLEQLRPLNDLRCAFDIRVGPLTNAERLCTYLQADVGALWVPEAMADLVRDEHDAPVNRLPAGDAPLLLLNARLPMPIEEFARLEPGSALVEAQTDAVIGARLAADQARVLLESGTRPANTITIDQQVLLSRPWHFKTVRDAALDFDLALIADGVAEDGDLPQEVMHIGEHRVIIDSTALVYPGVTLVAEDGPIVIAENATVRPGATIIGPAFIGSGSTVLEHAIIRGHTTIGPVCKVAGEISGCVFQGYANKAHDGFLGDSWIGEWVNLGAGTTNSNLLNTYAEVLCQQMPDGKRERTGETFLGAIVGDHVKTAIQTRLMTGCILYTGSMFAQSAAVAGTIGPFTWATDSGQREYRLSKFLDVMRTVMGRRDVEPSEAYLKRVAVIREETASPVSDS